ncbi:hypothetical protein [Methylobacterium thuringiense]|uniref:Uncharacterized protein n=1 Tax=Methylobacterium thuringiense TaxID=1003091 RepID=A0ABQ4THV7_9HYPH|nr:hypothetical protein [Methylobacterium thuringiense]GJE54531.1 hypothetical protein EKPJFOCH_1009 [Methylobacterium thuringiense]
MSTTPARPAGTAEIREALAASPTNPEALREAPPPIPVRGLYYLTECENCGWIGSSEQCGTDSGADDSDVYCPVCDSSGCEDEPSCGDTTRHGEAVYQRIVALEAERDAALAERDEAREERDALLGAAGFKPGSFRSALTRKVILDDVAGMRPEMVKARRYAERAQGDADLWTMRMLDEWPGDTLLLRLWRQKKEAKAERDAATAQADRTAGELAAAEAEKVRLKAALKFCLEELEWQIEQAKHCGDPNHECPMQDIHGPTDGHRIARDAARAALTEEPPHVE